ncbi:beta family protein [Vibrio anguillarum]|uniref:beta family protein n=1 Tax=Vibrio anguillarum TaxID=55601 RepID=UPI0002FA1918|nr:hypothetical protein [Vibrio anguillarum]OEE32525.1 hypothetical protein A1QW_11135 [Vibrio anguillarum]
MYYPYLRWKQGEIKALENEPGHWAEELCPIWIIENPQEGLVDAVLGIVSLWGGEQILDMSRIDIEEVEDDLYTAAISTQIPFCIEPRSLLHMGSDLLDVFKTKPCFRIALPTSLDDALDVRSHQENIKHILPYIDNSELKIVLDFGSVGERYVSEAHALAGIIKLYIDAGIKNIIVSGGSFPKTLQDVQGVEHIIRYEKRLYRKISEIISWPISYSDYATLSPDWSQSEIMRSKHINIRYTHDDYWVVLRQPGKDKAAIYELTKLLVLQNEFRGRSFSWADDIWDQRAEEPPQIGPGNSTFHVSEFIHHHIAQVIKFG